MTRRVLLTVAMLVGALAVYATFMGAGIACGDASVVVISALGVVATALLVGLRLRRARRETSRILQLLFEARLQLANRAYESAMAKVREHPPGTARLFENGGQE